MRGIALLTTICVLAGCATAPEPIGYDAARVEVAAVQAAPPPSPGSGVAVEDRPFHVEDAQVARAFLGPDRAYGPYRGNLPFGVILLRRNDTARNVALCNAFVSNLPSVEDVTEADPKANIIATYWLLTADPATVGDLRNCDTLLARYDYAKALQIRNGYGKSGAAGPIFLALQLNQGQGIEPRVAILDLSPQTPEAVAQSTIKWFEMAVSQADDVRSGDSTIVVQAQRELQRGRGMFDRIGDFFASAFCDLLGNRQGQQTGVAFADPVLDTVRGTLRTALHGNVVISFAASLIGDVLCRGRSV